MKSIIRYVVLIVLSTLLASHLIGCLAKTDEPVSFEPSHSIAQPSPVLRSDTPDVAATPKTVEQPKKPEASYRVAPVIGFITFYTLDEYAKFLKDNMSDKLSLGLKHFYTLVPYEDDIVIESYRFQPDIQIASVYAYRKSDVNKTYKFTWYFSDDNYVKKIVASQSEKKIVSGTQKYIYRTYDGIIRDKFDTRENQPPSMSIYWSQDGYCFQLYCKGTDNVKETVNIIDKLINRIALE